MKRICTVPLVLALIMVCVGCGAKEDSDLPLPDTSTMRISAILPHDDFDGYWSIVAQAILEQAQELPVDAKILLPQFNYNASQMTTLIHQSIAAQVDALIIQGIEDENYLAALEKAREQGILVVFIDTDVPALGEHLYIGTDNYQAGWLMGEKLVEITGGEARIAVLSGAPGYPNLELRLQGIRDAVEPHSGMEVAQVAYDHYDALTAMERYRSIIEQEPPIDTLLCIEGTGGQTFGRLLQPQDVPLKAFLVFDTSDDMLIGMKNGLFDGFIQQQNAEMGRIAVRELYGYSQTGSFSASRIHTDIAFITPEDLVDGEVSE